jgi:hypothetical protein
MVLSRKAQLLGRILAYFSSPSRGGAGIGRCACAERPVLHLSSPSAGIEPVRATPLLIRHDHHLWHVAGEQIQMGRG